MKMMQILENDRLSDIIAWHPNGEGFIVNDKERLETEVLPSFFKEAKYTSFNRRLKRWDFRIQRRGHKKSSYFHPLFFRHDYESLKRLHPLPQKTYHKKTKSAKTKLAIKAAAVARTLQGTQHQAPVCPPRATSYSNPFGATKKKRGTHDTGITFEQDNQRQRSHSQSADTYHRSLGLDMVADGAAINAPKSSASRPPFASVRSFQCGQIMPVLTTFDTPTSHLAPGTNMRRHLNQTSYMQPSYQSDSLPAPTLVSYSDSAAMGSYPVSRSANYSFYAVPNLPSRSQMISYAPQPAQINYNAFPQTDTGTTPMLYYQSHTSPQLNCEMIGEQVNMGAAYPYRM